MNTKLIAFVLTFPAVLWVVEGFVRWLLNDPDGAAFLYPTIASSAVCLVAPAALPQRLNKYGHSRDSEWLQFVGLCGLILGLLGWMLCVALSLRKSVPELMAQLGNYEHWQQIVALALYVYATVVYTLNESQR